MVGRAACQSASLPPKNFRTANTAAPATAATMASLTSQRLFFFCFGCSSSPLAAATTALPRFVASATTGAPAAALNAWLSLGTISSDILLRAASTAGLTFSSASSRTGAILSTAS